MIVTTTELRANLKEYLDLSENEEIFITRNGAIFAKISNPNADKIKLVYTLRGSLKTKMTEKEIQEERTKLL